MRPKGEKGGVITLLVRQNSVGKGENADKRGGIIPGKKRNALLSVRKRGISLKPRVKEERKIGRKETRFHKTLRHHAGGRGKGQIV